MTGPRGGVIGVKREQAIEALLTQMPVRFETSEEDPWLMGVRDPLLAARRAADSIEQVLMPRPPAAPQAAAPSSGSTAPLRHGAGRTGARMAGRPTARASRAGRTTGCRGRTSVRRPSCTAIRIAAQAAARPTGSGRRGITASASASSDRGEPAPPAGRRAVRRTGPTPRTASRGWPGRRACARRSCAASRA